MDSALIAFLALGVNTLVILVGGAAFVLKLDNRVGNLADAINNFANTLKEVEPVIHELREDTKMLKQHVAEIDVKLLRLPLQ